MERNFPVIPIFRNFRPTSRGTPKFRKMSVPFAPQPGISGIFGRMESAQGLKFSKIFAFKPKVKTVAEKLSFKLRI